MSYRCRFGRGPTWSAERPGGPGAFGRGRMDPAPDPTQRTGDRSGGPPPPPPPGARGPLNPHRLRLDKDRAVLGGVCAGIADYFGIKPIKVRALTVIGAIFFSPPVPVIYILLWIFLEPKPRENPFKVPEEEVFWRSMSQKPQEVLRGFRYRFRDMETRLARMERTVTSEEFELNREIKSL